MEVRYVPKGVKPKEVPKPLRSLFGINSSTLPNGQLKKTGTDASEPCRGHRVSVYFAKESDKKAAMKYFLRRERFWPGMEDHPPLKLADETSRELKKS
jgi:hypothetical protein